jgi:hypothetical protein
MEQHGIHDYSGDVQIDVHPSMTTVEVGPPCGPTEPVPAACVVTMTDSEPYDIRVRLEWSPQEGRLSPREITYSAHPGGEPVRVANINRMAIAELLHGALETAVLGSAGWAGIVERHPDADQKCVDALVYLVAVALDSLKPSATVALARGMSPASGPKRVAAARQAGLIPETEPGKAAGA